MPLSTTTVKFATRRELRLSPRFNDIVITDAFYPADTTCEIVYTKRPDGSFIFKHNTWTMFECERIMPIVIEDEKHLRAVLDRLNKKLIL